MPMTWTPPEVAAEHNGVTVYHTYKDGDCTSSYWYTLDESDDDWEGESAFDIRDLGTYVEASDDDHEAILKAAIEAGELKPVED